MPIEIKSDIYEITEDIQSWLSEIFPERTPDQVFDKLQEELEELRERPTDGHEWADVLILVFDIMEMYGIDPPKSIHWKMEINRKRKWKKVNGKLQHIKKEE